jgi:hypothetical protein
MLKRCVAALLLSVCVGAWAAEEKVAEFQEDLSASKLPNGIAEIGRGGGPVARKAGGYIFRFRDATFHVTPHEARDERPQSGEDVRDAVVKEKIGDLCYSPINGGTLVAWSGRISDLGKGYLHELDGKTLKRPPVIFSKEERSGKTGKGYPGHIEHIRVGHRYLIETVDQHYAVVRVLEKALDSGVVQWVYQPKGTIAFKIPKQKLAAFKARHQTTSSDPRQVLRPLGPEEAKLAKKAAEHLKERRQLIAQLIAEVDKISDPQKVHRLGGVAIRTLGDLRASEAVDALVKQVDCLGGGPTQTDRITVAGLYGCVGALYKIGKPAVKPAVKAIRDMHHFDVQGDENRRLARTELLTVVIHAVEGRQVAKSILEAELKKVEPESKKALQYALDYLTKRLPQK